MNANRVVCAAALATALCWLSLGTQPTLPAELIGTRRWTGDFLSYYLPNAEYLGSRLAHGELPLWDVRHGAGAPFLASLQSGALYPPSWLHAVLPTQTAFVVLTALHLAFAVWAAGALARAFGADALGAALSGVAYATSLRVLGEVWTPPPLYTSAWAPALWLCVERALTRPGARSAAWLAAAIALPLLAGWPYGVAIAALGAGTYALIRLIALALARRRAPLSELATLASGALLGTALAAPQLLPTLELLAQSCRALGSLDVAQAVFVDAPHLPSYFFRALAEHGVNDGVPGLLMLALTPLAFLPRAGRGRLAALLAVGLAGLLASFPNHAPIYGWLRELPVLGDFRFPYRYRLLSTLALAVTGGVGATQLCAMLGRRRVAFAATATALLALQLWTGTRPVWRSMIPFARTLPPARLLAESVLTPGATLGDGRLLRAGWSGRLRAADPARVVNDLEPLSLARTAELLTWFESGRPLAVSRTSGPRVPPESAGALAVPYYGRIALPDTPERAVVLDLFGVTLLVTPDPPDWLSDRYTALGRSEAGAVYANPNALPRARWVASGSPEPRGLQAVAAALAAPGFDPRANVLLDPAPAARTNAASDGSAAGEVIVREDSPEHLVLHTRSASDGYVVLTDAWFPGWEAQLDGAPVAVLRANLAFRAVAVPAGEHDLWLRYRPRPLRIGFAIAALALAAGAGAYALERRVSRARSRRSP